MEIKAEKITPYGTDRPKGAQVEEMFDNIAPAYDFMNRAMTLGIDRSWRRKVVGTAAAAAPRAVLDVATGTGDLALQLARAIPGAAVTGIDLSEGMLSVGRPEVEEAGLAGRITLQQGDCLNLPFPDGSFDVVTVAFGVRNFEHLDRGYAEMARVLRKGGTLIILELSVPSSPLVKPFYTIYTKGIIPLLGRMVSSDSRAYSYLPESIAAMPQGEKMLALMEGAGLTGCVLRPLTLGVSSIYTGRKA
ncbi:MAG: bifunctional demethylmenaquinone methyltransferase/2-methoxy-6-polyprenyl-1,4-benzoquinol methylase UbiE [Muribaculaceae bacterium]|nr:bifunctional demethylmenaquinone methyltransferase/2-methoxy-6-polyprenyl-1,4-benzoquinol methylase UbiE [Muribaculaceae bacterium]